MNTHPIRLLLCLVLSAPIMSVPVAAGEPPVPVDFASGPGGGFGDLYLLAQQAVQHDLQLSAKQLEEIHDLVAQVIAKQKVYAAEKDMVKRKELADETVKLRLENSKRSVAVLNPSQAQRLKQISLHYRGTASFYDVEVQKDLRLTEEQVAKIRQIGGATYSAWNREVNEEFRKNQDFKAYQAKLEENRKRRDREQVAVLTPEQHAQWQKMLGDPFKGPIPSPMFVSARAAKMITAQTESADAAGRIGRLVESLAQEVGKLKQELGALRAENERLKKQLAATGGPPGARPRFRDRGDYVEDTRTGLWWQKDGAASGKLNYYDAIKYATSLKLGGQTGWRVPTKEELGAIFPALDDPFTNTKYNPAPYQKGAGEWNSYWTSTLDTRLPDYAFVYHWYADGGANNCYASRNTAYVRCVRTPVLK
jgi:Spy/CpxP family protein refolding chaperone